MRKFSNNLLLFIAVIFIGINGCSLLEQDIDAEISGSKFVNETTEGVDIPYSDVIELDATTDQDIRDNLDKIKEWDVTKVSYSLSGFIGEGGTTFSGAVKIGPQSGSGTISTSVSGLDLKALSDSGEIKVLGFSETDLAKVAGWFDKEQVVVVTYEGTLSEGPTSFYLTVYINLRVKAKVL